MTFLDQNWQNFLGGLGGTPPSPPINLAESAKQYLGAGNQA